MSLDWIKRNEADKLFFRPRTAIDGRVTPLLWCYQSEWQRRLLQLYGQDMVLLDATYRVCRYSVPLFFVCVQTNVRYMVVAAFVTTSEESHHIQEALEILNYWNPSWRPNSFMMDFSAAERKAVQSVWPGKYVLQL